MRSEKAFINKASLENIKRGNGPRRTATKGSSEKLEGIFSQKYLGMGYDVGKKI